MSYWTEDGNTAVGVRAILAVSEDGYVAKGPDDDMSWTGALDKAFFRLFTLTSNNVCYVGKRTGNNLPRLPGRDVWKVRSKELPKNGHTQDGLNHFTKEIGYESLKKHLWGEDGVAVCLGGPTLIEALFKDDLVLEMVVCVIKGVNLQSGIPFTFQPQLDQMKKHTILKSKEYPQLEVYIYRKE